MIGSGAAGLFAAFALTFGLLGGALWLLRRLQGAGAAPGGSNAPVRLLRRIPVGPRQGIGLLQIGERILVISLGDGGARLLTELDDPELLESLRPAPPAPGKVRVRAGRTLGRIFPFLAAGALVVALSLAAGTAHAAPGDPVFPAMDSFGPPVNITVGQGADTLKLSGAVGLVVFLGFLTLLPAMLLLMTSFTRILIVLQFVRPAIGTQNAPPMQLLTALAVILTGVVMGPVLQDVNEQAIQPYLHGEITQADAYKAGLLPFRQFMLANVNEKDLALFTDLSGLTDRVDSVEQLPIVTVTSAFVTSELRAAFQMGFLVFIPFIVVDLVVASVLMSLGMFMLPPMMISLPFKLLLFVLADGWTLLVKNLVLSFR